MDPSTTRRGSAFWLTVFGLFATLAVPLLGQSTGGRIIGRIADPTGAVLDGVKVTLTNQATGVSRETQSNGNGDYTFVEVVPGIYQADLRAPGFQEKCAE